MPSSLIFTGLVVLWLLILVPAVARHQQEVARVSGASLAGRVLTRPRRRGEGHPSEEGDSVDDEGARTVGTRSPEVWVPAARRGGRRADTAVAVPPQARGDEPESDEDPEPGPIETELDTDADARRRRLPIATSTSRRTTPTTAAGSARPHASAPAAVASTRTPTPRPHAGATPSASASCSRC